jgi:hypothetical protein
MSIKQRIQAVLRRLLGIEERIPKNTEIVDQPLLKAEGEPTVPLSPGPEAEEYHSIWNFLDIKENTQAFHLKEVIGFEEWVDMEEIRRRIFELFGIQYKNERSLYPHLKTLVDLGLFETTDVGGRRKWRKKDQYLKIKAKKEKEAKATEKAKAEAKETEKRKQE